MRRTGRYEHLQSSAVSVATERGAGNGDSAWEKVASELTPKGAVGCGIWGHPCA